MLADGVSCPGLEVWGPKPASGLLCSTGCRFPTRVAAFAGERAELPAQGTHYGFVQSGNAQLATKHGTFPLTSGMYFSVAGQSTIEGGNGVLLTRIGYRGLFTLGGPIESTGRLRYIDGCSDTLVIGPAVLGDPCLNLLHIPPNTNQSMHTHPSMRAGIIASGVGRCVTENGSVDLAPGMIFLIRPGTPHCFRTEGRSLQVIAYHPETDFGPTHQNHPMINRTFLSDALSQVQ
jgi:mannose-6-phosphate isomerase-like protein (cupin superfamily)